MEMEQPTNLIAKLLSADDPDDRARMVFGLTSDDPLPRTTNQRRAVPRIPESSLSFPFQAEHSPASQTGSDTDEAISVVGFADPPVDAKEGIVCRAQTQLHRIDVPLSRIHVSNDDPNLQYIDDYTYWLWEAEVSEEEITHEHPGFNSPP